MRFAFILAEKANFPIELMCDVLQVSRSGFYRWLERKPSKRAKRHEELTAKVRAIFGESRGTYGSPRIHEVLSKRGESVTEKLVAKIMQEQGLVAREKRRYKVTTDSRQSEHIADNVLERDFTANKPDQVWVTDVKAIWTVAGWVYLAAIIDLFSRRVVGWAMSEHNDTDLALAALKAAIAKRKPGRGLIHHSDRGSPYASNNYINHLDAIGAIRSMSKKGDCWDNAVAESFFSTLEHELLHKCTFLRLASAHATIGDYIDGFYNPGRIHSTIGYVSPIEKELAFRTKQVA